MIRKFVVITIIGVFLGCGCKNTNRPEVKAFFHPVQIGRLDRDVFLLDSLQPDWSALQEKYGAYLDTYTQGVLQLGKVTEPEFTSLFSLFLRDKVMREVADSVAANYPDMKSQEIVLSWAWAYYRYYFPGRKVPQIYTHISGFNQSVVVDSVFIGVGLDNYLGEDCPFYDLLAVPVPLYARKKMTGRDIPRDVLTGWLTTEFPFRPKQNDLVSGMIYQGKMVYALGKLFPEEPREWLLGFSSEQWKWCEQNESQIWGFLIENEYLFSTQQRLIVKYLNDAPFTSGMPVESPGKTIVWTGYRIVEKYMQRSDISLSELLQMQDYHKILRESVYRP